MTKSQIRAELRRSACEDRFPMFDVMDVAFNHACQQKTVGKNEFIGGLTPDDCRTFFLLVAEAME
jgi:hypothetical protein